MSYSPVFTFTRDSGGLMAIRAYDIDSIQDSPSGETYIQTIDTLGNVSTYTATDGTEILVDQWITVLG